MFLFLLSPFPDVVDMPMALACKIMSLENPLKRWQLMDLIFLVNCTCVSLCAGAGRGLTAWDVPSPGHTSRFTAWANSPALKCLERCCVCILQYQAYPGVRTEVLVVQYFLLTFLVHMEIVSLEVIGLEESIIHGLD